MCRMALPTASPEVGIDRRHVLKGMGVLGAAALVGTAGATPATAAPRDYPFTLGLASGCPTADGVVLWTRLAPRPFEADGGMKKPAAVQWQVAEDSRMRRVVARGQVRTSAALAHSVHIELSGLDADRVYYYRFRTGSHLSEVGRTRTLPRPGARVDELMFAFASCQDYASGYYSPYAHMANDDLDFVVHLGDYVYEGGIPADGGYRKKKNSVPAVAQKAPVSLEQWRYRYSLYKRDPQLQLVHARFPWFVTWDDHEVINDYAGNHSQYKDKADITALRRAAYQAYYEHQPLPHSSSPTRSGMRIYRSAAYGDLANLWMLDGRQYRDDPPCGWGEAPACEAQKAPAVSMLGNTQERWLYGGLTASNATWNILGNNVMVSRLDHDGDKGDVLWHDAWDGFPAARKRLLDTMVDAGTRNPVFITGDWHSTFVNDVHHDFDRAGSSVVATEFVGTSITTNGDGDVYGPYYGPMIGYNPHIKFFDGDRRGYVRCTVDRSQWRTDLQMVNTVSRPDAEVETLASFVVEEGAPGAVRV